MTALRSLSDVQLASRMRDASDETTGQVSELLWECADRLGDRAAPAPAPAEAPAERLSPREMDVLQLLGEGLTSQQIAQRSGLAPSTVRTYLSKVYRKLGVADRTQAVIRAYERGWLRRPA